MTPEAKKRRDAIEAYASSREERTRTAKSKRLIHRHSPAELHHVLRGCLLGIEMVTGDLHDMPCPTSASISQACLDVQRFVNKAHVCLTKLRSARSGR